MLKFVRFLKTNVVLLILLRNCEKMQFRLQAAEYSAISFKHRADIPGDVLISHASHSDGVYAFFRH